MKVTRSGCAEFRAAGFFLREQRIVTTANAAVSLAELLIRPEKLPPLKDDDRLALARLGFEAVGR